MNYKFIPFLWDFYDKEVIGHICRNYNLSTKDALRKFMFSETYRMLCDIKLEMWDFAPLAIFDMWETEQVTGNPRDSIYIKGDY